MGMKTIKLKADTPELETPNFHLGYPGPNGPLSIPEELVDDDVIIIKDSIANLAIATGYWEDITPGGSE